LPTPPRHVCLLAAPSLSYGESGEKRAVLRRRAWQREPGESEKTGRDRKKRGEDKEGTRSPGTQDRIKDMVQRQQVRSAHGFPGSRAGRGPLVLVVVLPAVRHQIRLRQNARTPHRVPPILLHLFLPLLLCQYAWEATPGEEFRTTLHLCNSSHLSRLTAGGRHPSPGLVSSLRGANRSANLAERFCLSRLKTHFSIQNNIPT
jgi:hypothetical protein